MLAAGGWRLAAGGWRLAAGGWRLAAGGWRLLLDGLGPVELRRVVDEYLLAGRVVLDHLGEQVHQLAVVGHPLHVGVREVGALQDPVGRRLDQRLRERYCVEERLAGRGDALGPADLYPGPRIVLHELEELAEARLLHPEASLDPPHVIDDERDRELAQELAHLRDAVTVEVQLEVPAHRPDAVDRKSTRLNSSH